MPDSSGQEPALQFPSPSTPPALRRSWRRRVLSWSLYAIYLVLLAEIASRAYWRFGKQVPFLKPNEIWYAFYPELKSSGVETAPVLDRDTTFDVLVLGGSTASPDFGTIGPDLQAAIETHIARPVRLFNLAAAAKTSRDSWLKYHALHNRHFDLVVIYDGINDTRMNNCPREDFRDDYTHCSWYRQVQLYQQQPASWFALPYTIRYLGVCLDESTGLHPYIPRQNPQNKWISNGGDIKTEAAFRANLSAILAEATSKDERVLLMTFAYHIPANYSPKRFKDRSLDYSRHSFAVELWGTPEHVAAGIDRHNAVIRDLARQYPGALFVDQQDLMPKAGRYFDDCCHLTADGCKLFVQNIMNHVGDSAFPTAVALPQALPNQPSQMLPSR
jgi:hypothetical protein